MGVGPVAAPQFAGERMGVLQRHFAAVGLTDMGNDGTGFDGIILYQFGYWRLKARLRIFKCATPFPFVKGNTPAVFMRPGAAPR